MACLISYDFSGIPCAHAIACIWQKHQQPEMYVDDCYKKAAYMSAYKYMISPLNPIEQWPKTGLEPIRMPPNRAEPGRPKKLRRVEHDEVVPRGGTRMSRKYVTVRCSGCGKHGHNLKTCFRRQQDALVSLMC